MTRQSHAEANALHSRAVEYLDAGRLDEAEACCRKVLEIEPRHGKALANLGAILQRQGRLEEAERHYNAALAADSALAQCRFNLAMLLLERRQPEFAIEHLRQAVKLEPGNAQWRFVLGAQLHERDHPLEARPHLETAVKLDPNFAEAHEYLAGCLLNSGEAQAAVALYRRAAQLAPQWDSAWSNLLLALNYPADGDPQAIFEEHVAWGKRCAAGLSATPHANDPDPQRKLKIGYLSPDLRSHSVAYFLEPVLAHHERARIEVLCYSDAEVEDEVSARLRKLADGWHDVHALPNEALAQTIRAHGVDVLVDLAGHTAGGKRMPLFARKPAPVQASWLGYLNTTGLVAIDYRVSDWHACPREWDRYHTERVVRLPNSQWCYAPPKSMPEPGRLPARRAGALTFGAIQNFAKVTPEAIRAWSRVLQRVPKAKLLLVAAGMEQSSALEDRFARHGVDRSRLDVRGRVTVEGYFELLREVDIALDTFPYTGGTTTCHSLWMGVPIVTLSGRTVVSRGGASVLNVVGLAELVAGSEDEYVAIAARLASDLGRLEALRAALRGRLSTSPLTDALRFTRDLESAYREMWQAWCRGSPRALN